MTGWWIVRSAYDALRRPGAMPGSAQRSDARILRHNLHRNIEAAELPMTVPLSSKPWSVNCAGRMPSGSHFFGLVLSHLYSDESITLHHRDAVALRYEF